jgi:hypothetical protein
MLGDLVTLLKDLIAMSRNPNSHLFRSLIDKFVTLAIFAAAFTGWSMHREGSISAGITAAWETRLGTDERQAGERALILQIELRNTASADRVIQSNLESLLGQLSPTPARVRIGLIHNGITGLTAIPMLKFDVTHAFASPGRVAGALIVAQPLSDWSDYLDEMVRGNCVVRRFSDIKNPASAARLAMLRIDLFVACPIKSLTGRVMGGLFVSWDRGDPIPNEEVVKMMIPTIFGTANQIASVLDIRNQR